MTPARARLVLGVPLRASEAEVNDAFKRLVWAAHPDHGGSASGFAELSEARAVLLGPSLSGRSLPGTTASPAGGQARYPSSVIFVPDTSLLRRAVVGSVKWWLHRRADTPRRVV